MRYVAALDTTPPWRATFQPPDDPALVRARADTLAEVVCRQLSRPLWAPLLRRVGWPVLRLVGWLWSGRLPGAFGFYLQRRLLVSMLLKMAVRWRDGVTFWPGLSVPLLLLRAEGHPLSEPHDLDWSQHCADVRVTDVSGTHYTMFHGDNLGLLCNAFVRLVTEAHGAEEIGRYRRPAE